MLLKSVIFVFSNFSNAIASYNNYIVLYMLIQWTRNPQRWSVFKKKICFKEKNKKERWNNTDRKSVEQWTIKTKTDLENCKMKQTGGTSLVTISVISREAACIMSQPEWVQVKDGHSITETGESSVRTPGFDAQPEASAALRPLSHLFCCVCYECVWVSVHVCLIALGIKTCAAIWQHVQSCAIS